MTQSQFPSRDNTTIHFSQSAYQMASRFAARDLGIRHFQTDTIEATRERISETDVLVVSGFWRDTLLQEAPRLRYVQSISAGYDQYGLDALRDHGVFLCNASGVNADAVSHHALGLALALIRHLPSARDHHIAQAGHQMGELLGYFILGAIAGGPRRTKDRDLANRPVGSEDLEGVAQLKQGMIQHLEIRAEGLISYELEHPLEHLQKEIRSGIAVAVVDDLLQSLDENLRILVVLSK